MEQSASSHFYLSVEKRCLIFPAAQRQGEISGENVAVCTGISKFSNTWITLWLIFPSAKESLCHINIFYVGFFFNVGYNEIEEDKYLYIYRQ